MNKLLEQLKREQIKLGMSDYKFSRYLGLSKQLWSAFKNGKITRSRKVEKAAIEKLGISPERQYNPTSPVPVLVMLWDRIRNLLGLK